MAETESLLPYMRACEVRAIQRELLYRADHPLRVLEWGSGGSTVAFTRFLRDAGVPYSWLALEYNPEWYDMVSNAVADDPDTRLVLFDVGNGRLRQRTTNMDSYVEYPRHEGVQFDLILVDGRKRRRCLIEARALVASRGAVILHDAERSYYHCALSLYADSRFLSPFLWRGTTVRVSRTRLLANGLVNARYKSEYRLLRSPIRSARNWLVR